MKRLFTICTALAASMLATHDAAADPPRFTSGTLAAYFDEEPAEAPVAPVAEEPAADYGEMATEDQSACGYESSECAEDVSCGCCEEPSCECGNGCGDGCCSSCNSNGDLCSGWSLCECCPGDAWTMQNWLTPCNDSITYAGWVEMGYHSETTGLSANHGDLLDFNDVPDRVNLQQLWWYTEKLAEADACSADWGYRFDLVYGTDAQKTQAFGNSGAPDPQGWDNSWDHGVYGWAAPQAYIQYAKNDWSWKIGHWFTTLGYEVVPATGNFFYSRSLTTFNSEPFTHTGAIGTYTGGPEGTTYYAGWALGWDTGYDQFGDGNIFIGGVTKEMNDDVTLTYMTSVGNFGFRSADEFGYMHTLLGILDLTEKTQYVIQSDLVAADGYLGDDTRDNFEVGVVNYLFHTLNDCWKLGGRFEWWQSDTFADDSTAFFELTGGLNYRPHANVVVRPEIRYDFTADEDLVEAAQGRDYNREEFGIDVIFTF